ncbi:MAG: DinB family protein [Chloroflexota bacterium]
MTAKHFSDVYQYNDWANRRLWQCLEVVPDEIYFQDRDFSVGSLHEQVMHIVGVERWWLGYLITGEVILNTDEDRERLRNRTALRAWWDDITARNLAYIASLTADELLRQVKPFFWDDDDPTISVGHALTQVTQHSLDHRAQTMTLLHQLGYEGTDQEYLTFLRERTADNA